VAKRMKLTKTEIRKDGRKEEQRYKKERKEYDRKTKRRRKVKN
jgi:hypothetical protein